MNRVFVMLIAGLLAAAAVAHPGHDEFAGAHDGAPIFLAQISTSQHRVRVGDRTMRTNRPAQAEAFVAYAPKVALRWDDNFLYVESDGIPSHPMMIGITAWQQQVPLPQSYTGENAWQIPLMPVPAKNPVSIRGRFLRGAIAIAANGIPIFNPQNNRGEVSAEIGELDQWGGHCGRGDDYHYHAAPLHLQSIVGKGKPIAYALDGYAIFGLAEPDGSEPKGLDEFHGHTTASLGYHYHASKSYPYVNGGFHGEVVERDGQVDPQPRAQSVRPAMPPLRGATITNFVSSPDNRKFAVQYSVNGKSAAVNYATSGDGAWKFQFTNADGTTRDEAYRAGDQRGGGGGPGADQRGGPRGDDPNRRPPQSQKETVSFTPPHSGKFILNSSEVADGGILPKDFTGDGSDATLPLEWSGAPAGTKSFALIMHHIPGPGEVKWYWIIYDIPAGVHALPKNVKDIGTLGNNSVNDRTGYAPPHSKGPGPKTYILTVYALSDPPKLSAPPSDVNRATLLNAMKDHILDTAVLHVVYTRTGTEDDSRPPPRDDRGDPPPPRER